MFEDRTEKVVQKYFSGESNGIFLKKRTDQSGNGVVKAKEVSVVGIFHDKEVDPITGIPMLIKIRLDNPANINGKDIRFDLRIDNLNELG